MRGIRIAKIISGGQTGVDRAALDVALALNVPCGGWCPKGRKAEDGKIDPAYPLQETLSGDYYQRTEWNVRDADGLLVVCYGRPTGGTALAVEFSKKYLKPCFVVDLTGVPDKRGFHHWLKEHDIRILSVGGPRESHRPGVVYAQSKAVLLELLTGS